MSPARPPLRLRPWHALAAVAVVAALVLAVVLATRDRPRTDETAGPAEPVPAGPAEQERTSAPQRTVTLLWPAADASGLVPREASIFATASTVDQAKQVVGLLLGPPPGDDVVAPFPEGTRLEALFLDASRTAYVSLSREVREKAPGGSAWEILAVNALAGSLTQSLTDVSRIQILVEGQEIESLTGHLDLRGPVAFDPSTVASR